ncbi:MAG: DUF481 domain-containing protein [Candidatus Margulisiibacteriota bacterium]|nr:DUF481 domain-containing protein [Candidatus Margulisiibacteriota bacterium]
MLVFLSTVALAVEQRIDRGFSLGGDLSTGNTQENSINATLRLNRNKELVDETTLKASLDYKSANGADTKFKIYSSLRYAHSLANTVYSYAKMEFTHDKFQDIEMRFVPTAGVGRWFFNEDDLRLMGEAALGLQADILKDNLSSGTMVLTLSSDLQWWGLVNSFDSYFALDDFANYRFTDTIFYNMYLSEYHLFKIGAKDEYSNMPVAGVKNNDFTFLISFEYRFTEIEDI